MLPFRRAESIQQGKEHCFYEFAVFSPTHPQQVINEQQVTLIAAWAARQGLGGEKNPISSFNEIPVFSAGVRRISTNHLFKNKWPFCRFPLIFTQVATGNFPRARWSLSTCEQVRQIPAWIFPGTVPDVDKSRIYLLVPDTVQIQTAHQHDHEKHTSFLPGIKASNRNNPFLDKNNFYSVKQKYLTVLPALELIFTLAWSGKLKPQTITAALRYFCPWSTNYSKSACISQNTHFTEKWRKIRVKWPKPIPK